MKNLGATESHQAPLDERKMEGSSGNFKERERQRKVNRKERERTRARAGSKSTRRVRGKERERERDRERKADYSKRRGAKRGERQRQSETVMENRGTRQRASRLHPYHLQHSQPAHTELQLHRCGGAWLSAHARLRARTYMCTVCVWCV